MSQGLYPRSALDRGIFWMAVVCFALGSLYTAMSEFDWRGLLLLVLSAFYGVISYSFRNPERGSGDSEYQAVIDQIQGIGLQLSSFNKFLEQKKRRIADAENIVRRLEVEKADLQTAVSADRVTVDAILSAYKQEDALSVWKERGIGFAFGFISSLTAGFIQELIRP